MIKYLFVVLFAISINTYANTNIEGRELYKEALKQELTKSLTLAAQESHKTANINANNASDKVEHRQLASLIQKIKGPTLDCYMKEMDDLPPEITQTTYQALKNGKNFAEANNLLKKIILEEMSALAMDDEDLFHQLHSFEENNQRCLNEALNILEVDK